MSKIKELWKKIKKAFKERNLTFVYFIEVYPVFVTSDGKTHEGKRIWLDKARLKCSYQMYGMLCLQEQGFIETPYYGEIFMLSSVVNRIVWEIDDSFACLVKLTYKEANTMTYTDAEVDRIRKRGISN